MRGQLPSMAQLIIELQMQGAGLAMQCAEVVQPYAPVGDGQSRPAGTFRDSLTGRAEPVTDALLILIESDDEPVADIILHGSAAHTIEVRHAGSLRWESRDGAIHFAKRVQHPGTQANDFAAQAEADLVAVVQAGVDQAVEALAG